jgi:alpha-mannosidase
MKRAEDDEAVVFRLYETAGKDARASVRLGSDLMGAPAEAVEVDLLERPVPAGSARASKTGFTVNVPAHGIASVKVRFSK